MNIIKRKKNLNQKNIHTKYFFKIYHEWMRQHLGLNFNGLQERIDLGLPMSFSEIKVSQKNYIDYIAKADKRAIKYLSNGFNVFKKDEHKKWLGHLKIEKSILEFAKSRQKDLPVAKKVFDYLIYALQEENLNTKYEDFDSYEYIYLSLTNWKNGIVISINKGGYDLSAINRNKTLDRFVAETMELNMATCNSYMRLPFGTFLKVTEKEEVKTFLEEHNVSFEEFEDSAKFIFSKDIVKAAIEKAML